MSELPVRKFCEYQVKINKEFFETLAAIEQITMLMAANLPADKRDLIKDHVSILRTKMIVNQDNAVLTRNIGTQQNLLKYMQV